MYVSIKILLKGLVEGLLQYIYDRYQEQFGIKRKGGLVTVCRVPCALLSSNTENGSNRQLGETAARWRGELLAACIAIQVSGSGKVETKKISQN